MFFYYFSFEEKNTVWLKADILISPDVLVRNSKKVYQRNNKRFTNAECQKIRQLKQVLFSIFSISSKNSQKHLEITILLFCGQFAGPHIFSFVLAPLQLQNRKLLSPKQLDTSSETEAFQLLSGAVFTFRFFREGLGKRGAGSEDEGLELQGFGARSARKRRSMRRFRHFYDFSGKNFDVKK